ncbi:hypothetical protein GGD63_003202 [Bradyrhizobium sp. cir1]|nr:hypothetical protein [Bradyrhizobium sp. cir1]
MLDLYTDAPDPKRPVVCFDESPVQLIGEARQPIPAAPGRLERYDYEYRRNGTVNLFVLLDVHRPWRKVKVTERRAVEDYAHCMRDIVDVHYPDAEIIRVVQDGTAASAARAASDLSENAGPAIASIARQNCSPIEGAGFADRISSAEARVSAEVAALETFATSTASGCDIVARVNAASTYSIVRASVRV